MSEIEVITKSRLAAFSTCQRLHDITYNQGYRSLLPRPSASFGNFVHAGLDAWWLAFRDPQASLLALPNALEAMAKYRLANQGAIDDFENARGEVLMNAYHARWTDSMSEWEVLGAEVEFMATVKGRKRLRVAGKLDKLLRKRIDGSIWFGEHKTTGSDLSAGSIYWQRLRMDPQVSIYFDGCRELGHPDPFGCLYDVVERPAQRPLKATPVELRKYTKATAKEPSRLYANQRETDETVFEFRTRLAALVAQNPESYFGRAEVVRLESELESSRADVDETAIQIRTGSHTGTAPRNPGACFQYGRACEMFDVCCGVASLDDETKFRKAETKHEELSAKP